jgi:hypothetical protein
LDLGHGLAGLAVVLDHKRLGHDERLSNGCVQCEPARSLPLRPAPAAAAGGASTGKGSHH